MGVCLLSPQGFFFVSHTPDRGVPVMVLLLGDGGWGPFPPHTLNLINK